MKKLITPAFDSPVMEDRGDSNVAGVIHAANESRFVTGHFSEPLTGLLIGWKDPEDLEGILQRLFPEIIVPRRFSFKKAKNAQAFISEVDDIRAIGSGFKRVEYTGEEAEGKTLNKGLTLRIDHDETDDLEGDVARSIYMLRQRIARNELRRGFTVLDAADHAGGNTAFKVDTNPDGLIRAMAKASADSTGIYPNVFAIGELAWHYRLDAYEAAARVNSQSRANFTPQQLAQYLGADVCEVVKARYQSTAAAKANLLSARIYAYLAYAGMTKDDPSAIKRFRSNTRNGGGTWGVYRQDHDKWTDVTVEHNSNIIATGSGVESIDAVNT